MEEKLNISILKTLAYFDLFQYPLSKEEIHLFLNQQSSAVQLVQELGRLADYRLVFREGPWYSLHDDPVLHEKRRSSNRCAVSMMVLARRISSFLYLFPYVRAIGISGSLSKNCADRSSDIDYFIITRKNRLWICRTLMHLFKKLTFLTGHQKLFCMNYYIDESALCIEEKNIFTATELITLVPVRGRKIMADFFRANGWVRSYLPNYPEMYSDSSYPGTRFSLKRILESIFNNQAGEKLDNYLMRLTTKRWKTKEEENRLNIKGNRMGLKTGKHFSKPNPVFFQDRVISRYQDSLKDLEEKIQSAASAGNPQSFLLKEII